MARATKVFLGFFFSGLSVSAGGLLIIAYNTVEGRGENMYKEFFGRAGLELIGIAMLVFVGPVLSLFGAGGVATALLTRSDRGKLDK